jgi:GGDEF domain-containing protein
LEPKTLRNWIITFISTVSAGIVLFIEWERVEKVFFPDGQILTPQFLILLMVITNLIVFLLMYNRYFKEKSDHQKTKVQLENYKKLLYDSEKERLTDVVTGIPNEQKFKIDIQGFSDEVSQIILIDIDNFSSINKKHGFLKGDELIRGIAQKLYFGMRRDEEIYKRQYSIPNSFVKRVYRKYTGGDEFIFLVKGPQFEAVGFLTRVQKQLQDYSKEVEKIINEEFEINFHGAIAPLYPTDNYEQAFRRVQECFILASEEKDNMRVYWHEREEKNYPETDFRGKIYARAIESFKIK